MTSITAERSSLLSWPSLKSWLLCSIAAVLVLLPVYAHFADAPYFVTVASRMAIFALSATALNLVLGFGGMVSFGHSLFIGIGAYSVGICAFYGIGNGWVHLAAAVFVSATMAAITGVIALRTRGVSFIMITLAFAQMFYFLIVSLKQYGGDDGLPIVRGSRIWILDFQQPTTLYYGIIVVLASSLLFMRQFYASRFGLVLRGCMINENRMAALGYDTRLYKLAAYVMSGALTGIAGFFLANLTAFASPSYASWTVSGDLMIMAVLGGTGTIVGPAVGAFVFLLIEEFLKSLTDHWLGGVGVLIVAIGLVGRHGIWGSLQRGGS